MNRKVPLYFLSFILTLTLNPHGNAGINKFEKREKALKEALKIVKNKEEQKKIKLELADIYFEWAKYFEKNYFFKDAIDYYWKSYEINRTYRLYDAASDLNNIGKMYKALNKYEKAIEYLEYSLSICIDNDFKLEQGNILTNLGVIYLYLEKYRKVEGNCKMALEIYREIGFKEGEAFALNNLGELYNKQGHYYKAKEFHEKALMIRNRLGGQHAKAVSLSNIGTIYQALKDYDNAKVHFMRALAIFHNSGKKSHEAVVMHNLATVYELEEQYVIALDYFRQALTIFRNIGDKYGQAKALNGVGLMNKHLKRYKEAEKHYELALSISRAIGLHSIERLTLHNLGAIYLARCLYKKALDYYEQLLAINRQGNYQFKDSNTLNSIGLAYNGNGHYDKAITYYKQSLLFSRRQGDHSSEATTLNNLGELYFSLGNYKMAVEYFELSLSIFRSLGKQSGISSTINNLGLVHHSNDQYEKAMDCYEEALRYAREIGDFEKEGFALHNIGTLYYYLGRPGKAIECCEKSLELFRKIGYRSGEAMALLTLGDMYIYASAGEYEEAILYNAKINEDIRTSGKRSKKSAPHRNTGELLLRFFVQFEKAKVYFKHSLDILYDIGNRSGEGLALYSIGTVHSLLGEYDKAIDAFEKSIAINDGIRFELKQKYLKISFFENYLYRYKKLFNLYDKNANHQKAFETAEKSKSVVFSEMMAERGARRMVAVQNPEFQEVLDEEIQLLHRIFKTKTQVKQAEGDTQQRLSQTLFELNRELSAIQEEMKQKFPRYAELLYPGTIELKKLQKLLKKDETYVSFYLLEDYSVAFVVSQHSFQPVKIDVRKKWVEEKIIHLRNQIKQSYEALKRIFERDMRRVPKDFRQYPKFSNELYRELFKPLEPYITTKNVLISADGVLYGFPFEALVTKIPEKFEYKFKNYSFNKIALKQFSGNIPLFYEFTQMKYLGEKYSISYIPTASTLDVLRGELARKRETGEGLIAFADPIFSKNQMKDIKGKEAKTKGLIKGELYVKHRVVRKWPPDRLPETAQEAQIFSKQIGKGKIYSGLDASEENVWKAGLENAKYVLFSTHGILGKEAENKDITEPALVLSLVNNPDEYDGLLGMSEAAGLRLNSDVVILSACNSAGESGKGGEGFAGMARSFLFAGSQAVVASHWQVDTRATKMLIENYGKFLKTKGRLEALESARNVVKNAVVEYGNKRKIKVSYAHPYFWAAFVLLGER